MLCEFFGGNLEYQENLLVKYYTKHNHEVVVITSTFQSVFDYYSDQHDKKQPGSTSLINGAKIIRLPFAYNFFNRFRRYTSISTILATERPDLIYVHDIMLNILEAVAYVKKHSQTKMILDYHADYGNSGKNWISIKILHGLMRKYFLDRARPHLSRIFPVVPASARFLNEVYKVPYEEMQVLPLGADTDLGQTIKSKNERPLVRKNHGIPENAIVIFTGGKLNRSKQTHLLLEAVNNIADPDVHLLVHHQ